MKKKKGEPRPGEFVVCTIKNVNPHSALASLEEYDREGMIHISEIKSGWIRDIRKHVKIGQLAAAKVLTSRGSYLSLSLKRVDSSQKRNKLNDYNLSLKVERLFEQAAKDMGMTTEQAYEEAGNALLDQYGSLGEALKMASKNPAKVGQVVSKRWADKVIELAAKVIVQKEFELRAKVTLRSIDAEGVSHIRAVLKKAAAAGLDVKYISAPNYLMKYRTKDAKKGEKAFAETLDKVLKEKGVEAQYIFVK